MLPDHAELVQEFRNDRNTELLAIADDVYECILKGNPGLAIKLLTASVPWIQTEVSGSADWVILFERSVQRGQAIPTLQEYPNLT